MHLNVTDSNFECDQIVIRRPEMKRGIAILTIIILAFALIWGCATHTQTGAGIGGIVGAIAGAALDTDKPERGALIGGIVGTFAGGLVGRYYDNKVKDPDVPPPNELQLTMDEVWSTPTDIRPGKWANFKMRYTLLAPDFNQQIPVRERFRIYKGEKLIEAFEPPEKHRNSGTYDSGVEVSIPENFSEGFYTMRGIVEADGNTSERKTYFNLVKIKTPQGFALALRP